MYAHILAPPINMHRFKLMRQNQEVFATDHNQFQDRLSGIDGLSPECRRKLCCRGETEAAASLAAIEARLAETRQCPAATRRERFPRAWHGSCDAIPDNLQEIDKFQ